jgi:DNA-binding XRE family transcriptional regulator
MPRPYTEKAGRPKTFCDTCSAPIYDNLSGSPKRVTCGDCVQRRLLYFSAESEALGLEMREARKKNEWPQRTFALAMGCSQQFVAQVEKGQKKPTQKMRNFLLSVSSRKDTSCGEGLK